MRFAASLLFLLAISETTITVIFEVEKRPSRHAPQQREKISVSKPERELRDKDEEEQHWWCNGDRVDSLNLGVMLAYLPGPSGHHNLFE